MLVRDVPARDFQAPTGGHNELEARDASPIAVAACQPGGFDYIRHENTPTLFRVQRASRAAFHMPRRLGFCPYMSTPAA